MGHLFVIFCWKKEFQRFLQNMLLTFVAIILLRCFQKSFQHSISYFYLVFAAIHSHTLCNLVSNEECSKRETRKKSCLPQIVTFLVIHTVVFLSNFCWAFLKRYLLLSNWSLLLLFDCSIVNLLNFTHFYSYVCLIQKWVHLLLFYKRENCS